MDLQVEGLARGEPETLEGDIGFDRLGVARSADSTSKPEQGDCDKERGTHRGTSVGKSARITATRERTKPRSARGLFTYSEGQLARVDPVCSRGADHENSCHPRA